MNNTNQVRHFVITGDVAVSGGTSELADGVFAIVDNTKADETGLQAVSGLQNEPKRVKKFIMMVGENKRPNSRTTVGANSQTFPFAIEDVVSVRVNAPKTASVEVDSFVIGYDGHNPATSLKFKQGQAPLRIDLEVEGGALPFTGSGNNKEKIEFIYDFNKLEQFGACNPLLECEPIACKPVVTDIIKTMRDFVVGGRKLGDLADIQPVFSCNNGLGSDPYTTWELKVCDAGNKTALAAVQASVGVPVQLVGRKGSISTYQTMVKGSSAPTSFTPTTGGTFPECGACADGSTPTDKGFVYQFFLEDDGVDESSTIEGIFSDSTATRQGQEFGKGSYLVVLEEKIDTAEVAAFVAEDIPFTYQYLGTLTSICEGGEEDPISWTLVETCYGSTQEYEITVPDDKCGNDRLSDLQAAYPNAIINFADSGLVEVVVTLTAGTTGTANINIGGKDYTITFDTDLATTATGFVVGTNIEDVTIASDGSDIIIVGAASDLGTITIGGASDDLAGTVEAATNYVNGKGCQHTYTMSVPTNVVCEECDDAFLDFYESDKPEKFEDYEWKLVGEDVDGDCLCGIRITSKLYKNVPPIEHAYELPYIEDSMTIKVAAAGYTNNGHIAYGTPWNEEVAVTRLSHKKNRTHVAGNLLCREAEGYQYFQNKSMSKDYLYRQWNGHETRFTDLEAQYINYVVSVRHGIKTGFLDQVSAKEISYNFYVEVGKHNALEAALNDLASAAGIDGVMVSL